MRRFLVAAGALGALGVFAAACGDGPDELPTPTPTATPTSPAGATSQATPGTIDPPTVPDRNIEVISPPHGARLTQLETMTPADTIGGACVQVNFDDAPEQFQWFRMVFDDEEVTVSPDMLLFLPANAQQVEPEGGTMCYAPATGFSVGVHTVTVAVQNPRNPQEPTRQLVQWQFEVVE